MQERETSGKTPQRLTDEIIHLCNNNGICDLSYIPREPKDDCEEGDCFKNVKKYVAGYGGTALVGWGITSRRNLYLDCEAHAVWQNPDKQIIDITPNSEDCSQTLFSYQKDMEAKRTPSRFIPYTQSPLVKEYIELRNEFERIRCTAVGDTMEIPKQLMDRIIEIDQVFLQKVGRNDACPCGSGFKFKKCCGR